MHNHRLRRLRRLRGVAIAGGGRLVAARLFLQERDTPLATADDELIVRIEASPINPSDIGPMLAQADVAAAVVDGATTATVAPIPKFAFGAHARRVGKAIPLGNEGAGVVVAAGASPAAQALVGRTVGVVGGACYAQYRSAKVRDVLPFGPGITPRQGASWFVNPLTALGMVETMRLDGHSAIVHTAAASQLGRMLAKVCSGTEW